VYNIEVSISWGLEVLAPAHIVEGFENSQEVLPYTPTIILSPLQIIKKSIITLLSFNIYIFFSPSLSIFFQTG